MVTSEHHGLFVELHDSESSRAEEIAPGVVADYDEGDRIIAIEFDDVRRVTPDAILETLSQLGVDAEDLGAVLEALRGSRDRRRGAQ